MDTSSPTHRPLGVRSLYWRIVLTFCGCIAGVLAVQLVAVVVWLNSVPEPSRLSAFTHGVAADLAGAIGANPSLDVQQYVERRYPRPLASLYIIIAANGQVITTGPLR